jgi:hypothetical protein
MINRKNLAGESGSSNPFTLIVTAFCGVLVGAAAALVPAAATSGKSADSTTVYAAPAGYFPSQFVNQAQKIEPMPETF